MQNNQNQDKRIIINVCQTCRTPIYEGEPIYTSSRGQSSGHTKGVYGGKSFFGSSQVGAYGGHYSGSNSSESWAQCAWCYDQWQVEMAINRKFWIKWWIGGILLAVIAAVSSIFIWPGIDFLPNLISGASWWRYNILTLGSLKIPAIAPIILVTIISLTGLIGTLLPTVNRYKLRKKVVKL